MIIVVNEGQNLFDIALQVYGAVEGYRQLLKDNPSLADPSADLAPGQQLVIDESLVLQPEVMELFNAGSYRVNLGVKGNPALPPPTEEPVGSGEPVLIKDGAGNILATVEPGGVFEITSGFSFGFRIL